ncbi:MAG: hypothetical protein JXJ04_25440 [Spirochaetales bacterium]|nr:hypothetical protein [Spirochaetales bacterium]
MLKKILIMTSLIFSITLLHGEAKSKIEADFIIKAGDELEAVDYYTIKSDIELEFEPSDTIKCELELESDRFEVTADEISIAWSPHDYAKIKIGKFNPELTFEDYILNRKQLFTSKSIIADYIDYLGYTISNIGGKFYKTYSKKTIPVSYFIHTAFNSTQFEPEVILGFFYHFNKSDSYLGLLGCYLPYFNHNLWLPPEIKSQTNNFITNLIFSDYENDFIYGIELSVGTNLLDPIGLLHFPGKGEYTLFGGADVHTGYKFHFSDINWIPAFRFSILYPNVEIIDCPGMEILAASTVSYDNILFLTLDSGLGINVFYDNEKLYTQLEFLWGIKLSVRI